MGTHFDTINEISDDGVSVEVYYTGPIVDEGVAPSGGVTPGALITYSDNADAYAEAAADATSVIGYAGGNVLAADPAEGTASDLRTDYAEDERFPIRGCKGDVFWGIIASLTSYVSFATSPGVAGSYS